MISQRTRSWSSLSKLVSNTVMGQPQSGQSILSSHKARTWYVSSDGVNLNTQPHSGHLVVTTEYFSLPCSIISIIVFSNYRNINLAERRPAFGKNLEIPRVFPFGLSVFLVNTLLPFYLVECLSFFFLYFLVPIAGFFGESPFVLFGKEKRVSYNHRSNFLVPMRFDAQRN